MYPVSIYSMGRFDWNRRIWKNRSTQNWLKSSATEPQIVSKPHRKDVAPGAGLSYPALARRHSSVGEDKASCMTRISLGRPGCWQGKHTLTIFSDSSRVHAGPPGVGFELLEHEPFSALLHYRNRGKARVWNFLCETCLTRPRKALCLAMSSSKVFQKGSPGSGGIWTHAPEETGALIQRLRPLGHTTHWACAHGSLRLGIVRPDADSAKKLQSNPLYIW